MTIPPISRQFLAEVMEPTWPAKSQSRLGPFLLRDGAGGGKRVCATTAEGDWTIADLEAVEAAMPNPLFAIRQGDEALDSTLAAKGYQIIDPVVIYRASVSELQAEIPDMAALPHWPPLALAVDIWAEGDILADRLSVMARVKGPKTALIARHGERLSGVAFTACHGDEAMLHALVVRPNARRQGIALGLMHGAANWSAQSGAEFFSLAVTEQNIAARALYARLGMQLMGRYHYRIRR